MRETQAVKQYEAREEAAVVSVPSYLQIVLGSALGFIIFGLIGTWLVWYSKHVEHTLVLEDIRGACQRVMPETIERCVDTVIIQRGGARR